MTLFIWIFPFLCFTGNIWILFFILWKYIFIYLIFPFSPKDITLASITQPAAKTAYLETSLNISCTHTFSNYYYLYWYQQTTQDKTLKLLGYLYTSTFNSEAGFERFHIYGNAQSHGTLQITKINSADPAVYFCAVSDTVHQGPVMYNINTSHRL